MARKPKIQISKNGPYVVTGNVPLHQEIIQADENGVSCAWSKGKDYTHQETYSLCRCGLSSTKPFCDGSHLHSDFQGDEIATHDPYIKQAERIEGPELDLTDAYDLCASARFCDRGPGTWELVKKSGDRDNYKMAAQEAGDCPSGRLVVYDRKTGKAIEPHFEPSISIIEDPEAGVSGPIWVKGGIEIESSDGYVYEARNRVTLCRCGHSKNKPFCDSEHVPAKFKDGDESIGS